MSDTSDQLATIAGFSTQYRTDQFDASDDDADPEADPFRLRFLLKNIFASARSETVSTEYRQHTESVLRNHRSTIRNRWSESSDGISDEALKQKLADQGVGNQHDRRMVVEVLDFLGSLHNIDHDVITYTQVRIENGSINEVYAELNDIHNVGPKKATLYLRDVVTRWELEDHLEGDQYRYVFPVDVWVFRVAKELGIVSTDSLDWETNSTEIVEACGESVSPIAFNQGAWYLGANAFEIIIKHLDKI